MCERDLRTPYNLQKYILVEYNNITHKDYLKHDAIRKMKCLIIREEFLKL